MQGTFPARTATWIPSVKTRPFRLGLDVSEDPSAPLGEGQSIGGRYRVVRLLGTGGMGRVYEAEHVALARKVAIKILRRDREADLEQILRFEQEARTSSRVGHPGIVEVVDFDRLADGRPYLVMELLRGQTLEDWMDRPGVLADGLGFVAQVCRALGAAHDAGVLHRDIKPANVFLHEDGGRVMVKLLDFGVAKLIEASERPIETKAGSVLGTPYYMAPERVLGRPLDARSDLYSLGVVLYELCTGQLPFSAANFMTVVSQHIGEAPLDPRQAAPARAIPDSLAALISGLLAKEPERRPPDAGSVADALDAVLAAHGEAVRAVVTGPSERASSTIGADTTILGPRPAIEAPSSAPPLPRSWSWSWAWGAAFAASFAVSAVWVVGSAPPEASALDAARDAGEPAPGRVEDRAVPEPAVDATSKIPPDVAPAVKPHDTAKQEAIRPVPSTAAAADGRRTEVGGSARTRSKAAPRSQTPTSRVPKIKDDAYEE